MSLPPLNLSRETSGRRLILLVHRGLWASRGTKVGPSKPVVEPCRKGRQPEEQVLARPSGVWVARELLFDRQCGRKRSAEMHEGLNVSNKGVTCCYFCNRLGNCCAASSSVPARSQAGSHAGPSHAKGAWDCLLADRERRTRSSATSGHSGLPSIQWTVRRPLVAASNSFEFTPPKWLWRRV